MNLRCTVLLGNKSNILFIGTRQRVGWTLEQFRDVGSLGCELAGTLEVTLGFSVSALPLLAGSFLPGNWPS